MKQIVRLKLLVLVTFLLTTQINAQTVFHVTSGTNFFITNSNYVIIDSLVLKPSANYNIPGTNTQTRDAVAAPPPPAAYIQRVYHFLAALPPYSGDVGIYYRDAELTGLAENGLTLQLYDGNAWNMYAASVTRDAAVNFVNTSGLSNILMSQATLSGPPVALPVKLSSFTFQNNGCSGQLRWATSTEHISKHFEIQQSKDGNSFATIGTVAARGNSTTDQHYQFSTLLPAGAYYFRLRMVDIDGKIEFSPILSIRSQCADNPITLYPNPSRYQVTVSGVTPGAQLRLLNTAGQVSSSFIAATTPATINVSSLPAGIYIIQVLEGGKVTQNLKFIKE